MARKSQKQQKSYPELRLAVARAKFDALPMHISLKAYDAAISELEAAEEEYRISLK